MANPNSKFRKGILIAYGCGIGSFIIGVTGVLLESVFSYSTATSVGGQMVIPGMIAGICGFAFYQFFKKRKFIAICLASGLGFGLLFFLNSILVQIPSNLKQVTFVSEQPVLAFFCGFIGGFVGGIILYMSLKKRKVIT